MRHGEMTLCVGGHFLGGDIDRQEWCRIGRAFFEQFGTAPNFVGNAKGSIVRYRPVTYERLVQSKLENLSAFAMPETDGTIRGQPGYFDWLAASALWGNLRSFFLGLVSEDAGEIPQLRNFVESVVLQAQPDIWTAYVFRRRKRFDPQSFVVGIGTGDLRDQYPRELMQWWNNRRAFGEENRAVRDVFEINYFDLETIETDLCGLPAIAAAFGTMTQVGRFLRWEVPSTQTDAARRALMDARLICEPRPLS